MINIKKKKKADVLAALYNRAKPAGIKLANFSNMPMSSEDATHFLENRTYFDYLNGRHLMVNLSSSIVFDETQYDAANGIGTAQAAVDSCPDVNK